jgi:hypothetical protein
MAPVAQLALADLQVAAAQKVLAAQAAQKVLVARQALVVLVAAAVLADLLEPLAHLVKMVILAAHHLNIILVQ